MIESPREIETPCSGQQAVEHRLQQIMESILGNCSVGRTDSFLELQNDADSARRLLISIEETFGRKLSMDGLIETPTVESLANLIRKKGISQEDSSIVPIQPRGTKAPIFAIPPSASPGHVFGGLASAIGRDQPFFGLRPPLPDGKRPPNNWYVATARHYLADLRRIQPTGPYNLLGRCWGGFVVYEMARQLQEQNERVGLLALLDSGPPLISDWSHYYVRLTTALRIGSRNCRRRLQRRPPIEYAVIPNHRVHYDLVYSAKRATANYDQLVWDANLRGAAEYRMRPLGGHLSLIQNEAWGDQTTLTNQWSTLVDCCTFCQIPGTHSDMLYQPNVKTLADCIGSLLSTQR